MSRYDEICQRIIDTNTKIKTSQRTFEETFLVEFAEYLGCQPQMLKIRFGEPSIKDSIVTCDFDLTIHFKKLNIAEKYTVSDLSYMHGIHGEDEQFTLTVCGAPYDFHEAKNAIFESIFQEVSQHII